MGDFPRVLGGRSMEHVGRVYFLGQFNRLGVRGWSNLVIRAAFLETIHVKQVFIVLTSSQAGQVSVPSTSSENESR